MVVLCLRVVVGAAVEGLVVGSVVVVEVGRRVETVAGGVASSVTKESSSVTLFSSSLKAKGGSSSSPEVGCSLLGQSPTLRIVNQFKFLVPDSECYSLAGELLQKAEFFYRRQAVLCQILS